VAVSLRFLGTGDPVSSGGRMQACILVEDDEGRFLLDCGVTGVAAMRRLGVDPLGIAAVLVSHLHGDHVGGVPFLLLARYFAAVRGADVQPLIVAGPVGTEQLVGATLALFRYGTLADVRAPAPVEFVVLEERREVALGGRRVTALPVEHFAQTLPTALRVATGGRLIAYSGDASWTDALVEAADGADAFVCDCYFYGGAPAVHAGYRTLRELRPRLRCRRLVLTHFGPDMIERLDEVRAELAGDPTTLVADDGMTLQL
jgi:ribonuclease BN (tRNA processing enzyme)